MLLASLLVLACGGGGGTVQIDPHLQAQYFLIQEGTGGAPNQERVNHVVIDEFGNVISTGNVGPLLGRGLSDLSYDAQANRLYVTDWSYHRLNQFTPSNGSLTYDTQVAFTTNSTYSPVTTGMGNVFVGGGDLGGGVYDILSWPSGPTINGGGTSSGQQICVNAMIASAGKLVAAETGSSTLCFWPLTSSGISGAPQTLQGSSKVFSFGTVFNGTVLITAGEDPQNPGNVELRTFYPGSVTAAHTTLVATGTGVPRGALVTRMVGTKAFCYVSTSDGYLHSFQVLLDGSMTSLGTSQSPLFLTSMAVTPQGQRLIGVESVNLVIMGFLPTGEANANTTTIYTLGTQSSRIVRGPTL